MRAKELIRVLHVIGIMDRGGAETMIMNLYRNIDRARVQFDFVENCFDPAAYDNEIIMLGGKIYRCPHYTGKNHLVYVTWWNDFFNKHAQEYRIIHGHIGSTASIYLAIAKRHGLYTIAHSHSINGKISLREIMYRVCSYRTRFIADFFFACSIQAGHDRFGKHIVQEDRFRVLKNAIDINKFTYNIISRNAIRQELGFTNEQMVIGHVGRFVDVKNHDLLIQIFYELSKMDPEAKLLLIGDGPLRTKIEERIRSLDLKNCVFMAGIKSNVNEYLQAMDIFLFPSKKEGLGIVLVEAQTADLPCVISDKIPEEALIIKRLINTRSLNDSPKLWANQVLFMRKSERVNNNAEIKTAGYDIIETAKWLEDFYCERAQR